MHEKKRYKITFDLKEGYDENAKEHTLQFAAQVIKKWMEGRLRRDLPIVNGLLQGGTLFFPSVENKKAITVTHSAIFSGELSSKDDMQRKNKEVKRTLESLAFVIKEQLKQKSVFIIYRKENWFV